MPDPGDRAYALGLIGPRPASDLFDRALGMALEIEERQAQDWALAQLVPHLPATRSGGPTG